LNQFPAVGVKSRLDMGGLNFFLADYLPFDAFAKVEAAKAGHRNPFVWELPMEENRSFFQRLARPKP